MKYFTLKIYGEERQVRFQMQHYHDKTEAIELIEFNGEYEEPWSRVSVNTGVTPPSGTFWAKTWSENKETFLALLKGDYLEVVGPEMPCGFAMAVACKLTAKGRQYLTR